MRHLTFHFDVLSPYAWLAFERLPEVLCGLSCSVSYQPVFLPALLRHWGQKGPVEIAPKRDWVRRHVDWLARRQGLALQWPAPHPFSPLPLLRLAQACAPHPGGTPGRWVVETLFRHVWQGDGADPLDPPRLAALREALRLQFPTHLAALDDPAAAPEVKAALRAATDQAIAAGVFGVPALVLDGELFWGQDSLEMLSARLSGEA